MPTIKQSDNHSNSLTVKGLDSDEFLPLVLPNYKKSKSYNSGYEIDGLEFINVKKGDIELSEHLDNDTRIIDRCEIVTNVQTFKVTFAIKKGSVKSEDPDGILRIDTSLKYDEEISIISITKDFKEEGGAIQWNKEREFKANYDSFYTIEFQICKNENVDFTLQFYAKDDEDDKGWFSNGELINIFCGSVKIKYKSPNDWQFSEEKIKEVRKYAISNNTKYNQTSSDPNRYHHCTDTHKYIIRKLLINPESLDLGKDQNHSYSVIRDTPKDFEKAGESTTKGVRDILIGKTYAEKSKIFTVIDVDGNEVLNSNGSAGNTQKSLMNFAQSPIEFIKNNCPDNGFYVFIGAYNDDYHSFTIIVHKNGKDHNFEFIDQIVGIEKYNQNNFENDKLLDDIYNYNFDFPMKLELYQLRNKKK